MATFGLLLLYGLQYVFIGLGASVPVLSAFHVVNSLVIFWSAARLAEGARQLVLAGRNP